MNHYNFKFKNYIDNSFQTLELEPGSIFDPSLLNLLSLPCLIRAPKPAGPDLDRSTIFAASICKIDTRLRGCGNNPETMISTAMAETVDVAWADL
jgi:hypothetical protein